MMAAASASNTPNQPEISRSLSRTSSTGTAPGSSNGNLNCRWTFWFDNPRFAPPGSDWKDNLKNCGTFDNIEDFWRIYNNLKPPSQLSLNSNYHVFREGILPTWEAPENIDGGKFVYTIQKKISKTGVCDEKWMFSVLAIIGETLDLDGDQVVGAVVSIRKSQDRIALWIKSSEKHICTQIGLRWKKALDIPKVNLKYQIHRDGAYPLSEVLFLIPSGSNSTTASSQLLTFSFHIQRRLLVALSEMKFNFQFSCALIHTFLDYNSIVHNAGWEGYCCHSGFGQSWNLWNETKRRHHFCTFNLIAWCISEGYFLPNKENIEH
jgi:translation initiation factor 4E